MNEDTELAGRCVVGDAAALEELILKYRKQLYAFILRMVGDVEDAKDLTQTAFMNMAAGIRGFRGEASFKTWLYRIATNVSMSHMKRGGRFSSLEDMEAGEKIPSDQEGMEASLMEKERRELLKLGLKALPQRQRAAVLLRAYGGLSLAQTAAAMGCSEGAVKAHYSLGVKKLKEVFSGDANKQAS